MNRRDLARAILALATFATIDACAPYGPGPGGGYGPPPHAPAHGYRHRLPDGVELVYDAGLGVYVVIGYPDYYFLDGRYYRYFDNDWLSGPGVAGPWVRPSSAAVPPGLRKKGPGWRPPGRRHPH